jgi:hypothetical protein
VVDSPNAEVCVLLETVIESIWNTWAHNPASGPVYWLCQTEIFPSALTHQSSYETLLLEEYQIWS